MAIPDPVGPMGIAKSLLRTSLSESATFQAVVDAADAAEALEHVYVDGTPRPSGNAREYTVSEWAAMLPFAVISTEQYRDDAVGMGGSLAFTDHGVLRLHLAAPVDEATAAYPDQCGAVFENVLDGIVGDLKALAGQGGYFAFIQVGMPTPVYRGAFKDLKTVGDCFFADLLFTW